MQAHCRRLRKTGPCHALTVATCREHWTFFTLYPPGFVPYGRQQLAPADGADDEASVVGAAASAASGELWSRGPCSPDGRWRSTQRARVERVSELLGIGEQQDHRKLPPLARVLDVDVQELRAAARDVAGEPLLMRRASGVMRVLGAMRQVGTAVFDRLLSAGHLVGLWGPVSRCDGAGLRLRQLFPARKNVNDLADRQAAGAMRGSARSAGETAGARARRRRDARHTATATRRRSPDPR